MRYNRFGIFIFVFFCLFCFIDGTKAINFHFNKNKQFKIAQFTDIHWDNRDSATCRRTRETMVSVLNCEKPDLAILTGDVVCNHDKKGGWKSIGKIFANAKIPWTVTMGNHDSEGSEITRKGIFNYIRLFPYFVGKAGLCRSGVGNYVIPVFASRGYKIAALLYALDSNNHPESTNWGEYNWIQFPQIQWYNTTASRFKLFNRGKALPSLAFFHIALPEFEDVANRNEFVGTKGEKVSCPVINSGLFCSFLQQKDVMGVFVGHDHDNDFIGLNHTIALSYGRVSGWGAYGRLERGARIILMYENEFKFDTWIRTAKAKENTFYYPSGLSEQEILLGNYLSAAQFCPHFKNGVHYSYYEGKVRTVEDIQKNERLVKEGVLTNFSISPAISKNWMAFIYKAWLKIPKKSVYRFSVYSDDGARLYIDDVLVADNNGSHSGQFAKGKVALDKGFHRVRLLYNQNYMGADLKVKISGRTFPEQEIPDSMLYIK